MKTILSWTKDIAIMVVLVAVIAFGWITLFGLGENDSPSHGNPTSVYDPAYDSGHSAFCSGGIEC